MKYAEYLELKDHDASDLLPNDSGKKQFWVCIYREQVRQIFNM